MKKLVIFCLLFFLLLALIFFLNSRQNQAFKRELIQTKDLKALACDLNENSCEYDFKGQKIVLEFTHKPLQALEENELIIKNLGSFDELNARLYGLNMYMGAIVPNFEKITEKDYKADIVLSACVLELMRYRLEFFDADKPLGFYVDFDLKR